MKGLRRNRTLATILSRLCGVTLAVMVLTASSQSPPPAGPAWWRQRGVQTSAEVDDFALANAGQLKNIATQALAELQANLPGGAGSMQAPDGTGYLLTQMVAGWQNSTTNADDYSAINLGQLKAVAGLFYQRLQEVGYCSAPPWAGGAADDFAVANLGQLKNVFGFDVTYSSLNNGLPDWWQRKYFQAVGVDPGSASPAQDGYTVLEEYQLGRNPLDAYNGAAPDVQSLSSTNVQASPSTILGQPLVIQVLDGEGHPMPHAPVTFLVTSGSGKISATNGPNAVWGNSVTVVTDGNGEALIYVQTGASVGLMQISATAGTAAPITFNVQVKGGGGNMVSEGSQHTVAVRGDGTVWAWGLNVYGQLGNGTTTGSSTPVQVTGLSEVTTVAAGGQYCLALKSDGTVWAWGDNEFGQLGNGTLAQSNTPVQVPGLSGVVAIVAGAGHSLALESDGSLWVWGYNEQGEAGVGSTTNILTPVQVTGLGATVISMSAGGSHSLAVTSDGQVWSWGYNGFGELGNGTTDQSLVPVQVSQITNAVSVVAAQTHSLAVTSDGHVWAWGNDEDGELGDGQTTNSSVPVQVSGLANVVAVASEGYANHSLALESDGSVWAWGDNYAAQLGSAAPASSLVPIAVPLGSGTHIVALAAGRDQSMAVTADGNILAWGGNDAGKLGAPVLSSINLPVEIPGLANMTSVAAGSYQTLAIASNGTLWAWGENEANIDTAIPAQVQAPGFGPVVAAAGGSMHSLAVTSDGTLWTWGLNIYGVLGDGTWGGGRAVPAPVSIPIPGGGTVVAVAGGFMHSLALDSNGNVWAWGQNDEGQLGTGSNDSSLVPVQVTFPTAAAIAIATSPSGSHSLALMNDGTVYAWGANGSGQLGDGTTNNSASPLLVPIPADVVAIAAGADHSMALTSDGNVWTWGANSEGQLGNGTMLDSSVPTAIQGVSSVTAIAAGAYTSTALELDSTVWAWGDNSRGELGDGTTTGRNVPAQVMDAAGATAIAGGAYHLVAIKQDGTLETWGDSSMGQLGMGFGETVASPTQMVGFNLVYTLPQVAFTTPAPNSTTTAVLGQPQTLDISLTAGSNALSQVQLWTEGYLIQTSPAGSPITWTPSTWGDFVLTAVAVDQYGAASVRSEPITLRVPWDSDGNGLPDWWEVKNFGHVGVDPNADVTGDGITNFQAYLSGVDPNRYLGQTSVALSKTNGDGQSGQTQTILPQPLQVLLVGSDGVTPLLNSQVTFTVTQGTGGLFYSSSSNGSIPATTLAAMTDGSGIATVYYQTGSAAETDTITASAWTSSVAFAETTYTTPPSGYLNISSGNMQVSAPGATVAQPLKIWMSQYYGEGSGIPGAPIQFTVTSTNGGGLVTDPNDPTQTPQATLNATTDQFGYVQAYFVMPNAVAATSTIAVSSAWASTTHPVFTEYTALATGIVGHWTFDEGMGTVAQDISGNGNDATLTGPVWNANAAQGPFALEFDGGAGAQSMVIANDTQQVLPADNFHPYSIAFWIKPQPLAPGTAEAIMTNEVAGQSGFRCAIDNGYWNQWNPGYYTIRFWNSDDGGYSDISASIPEAEATNWHHVVLIYDGQTARMLVDNNITYGFYRTMLGNTQPLTVGQQINGLAQYPDFNGLIDDLIIYPTGLTEDTLDSNNDGMADWWEMAYFGTLAVDPVATNIYSGKTNLALYQIGANPNDPLDGAQGSITVTGAGQIVWQGLVFPHPIVVHLASATGQNAAGELVTVNIPNYNATILNSSDPNDIANNTTFTTDASGNLQFWVLSPAQPGQDIPLTIQAGPASFPLSTTIHLSTQVAPPPKPPSNVSVTYGSNGAPDVITWADPYGDQDGFLIERQDLYGNWSTVATVDPGTTNFTVNDASQYGEANYRVSSTLLGLSSPSTETNPAVSAYAVVFLDFGSIPFGGGLDQAYDWSVSRLTNSGKILAYGAPPYGDAKMCRFQNGRYDLLAFKTADTSYSIADMNEAGTVVGTATSPVSVGGLYGEAPAGPGWTAAADIVYTQVDPYASYGSSQPCTWSAGSSQATLQPVRRFPFNLAQLDMWGAPNSLPHLTGQAGQGFGKTIDDDDTYYGSMMMGFRQGDPGATYKPMLGYFSYNIPWTPNEVYNDGFQSPMGQMGSVGFGGPRNGTYVDNVVGQGVSPNLARNGNLWQYDDSDYGSLNGQTILNPVVCMTNSGDLLETDMEGTYNWQGGDSSSFTLPAGVGGSIITANSHTEGGAFSPQYLSNYQGQIVLWQQGNFSDKLQVHSLYQLTQGQVYAAAWQGVAFNDLGWIAVPTGGGIDLLVPVTMQVTETKISDTQTQITVNVTTEGSSGTTSVDGSTLNWTITGGTGLLSDTTGTISGGTATVTVTHDYGASVTVAATLSNLVTDQVTGAVTGPTVTAKVKGVPLSIAQLDDAVGPAYRRVALNGRAIAEPISGQKVETESEGEQTYVDAMTLRLQHSNTDLYVPIENSELSLSVRRNLDSEIWNKRAGLLPTERRDRPFGAQWSSNLTPHIHFAYQQPIALNNSNIDADYAYVTDEEGNQMRFVILGGQFGEPGAGEYFIPFPSSKIEQANYLATLTNDGNGNYTLTKERGTVLHFQVAAGLDTTVDIDRYVPGSQGVVLHRYARVQTITDRLQYSLFYNFASGDGLIPGSITSTKTNQSIIITTDGAGHVTSVQDPNGDVVHYTYAAVTPFDGRADDGQQLASVTHPADAQGHSPVEQYLYDTIVEPDSRPNPPAPAATDCYHIDLKQLIDARNNSHFFTYTFDHARLQYDDLNGYYATNGMPRNLASVALPDGVSNAYFQNHSLFRAVLAGLDAPNVDFQGYRSTYIVDAAGHSRLYQFLNNQVILMNNFKPYANNNVNPVNMPRQVLFGTMQVTHYADAGVGFAENAQNYTIQYQHNGPALGVETVNYDLGAGLSVASYTDINNHTTSYTHGDVWNVGQVYPWLNTYYPYGRYPEPTQRLDAYQHSRTFEYDSAKFRLLTRMTDELGRVTQYTLGAQGQTTEETVTDPVAGLIRDTIWSFDPTFLGFATKQTVENLEGNVLPWEKNVVTSYTPDVAGRVGTLVVDSDPGGLQLTTVYTYDANSNKKTVLDPRLHTTSFDYDSLNRLIKTTYPLVTGEAAVATKTYQYDLNGNKIAEVDERGYATLFAYDAFNRLTDQARDMDGDNLITRGVDLVTSYTYNAVDSRLTVQDPLGNVTTTHYDGFERPDTVTEPIAGYVTHYGYDGGNSGPGPLEGTFKPTSMTDARGYLTTMTYDDLYRLTQKSVIYDQAAGPAITTTGYDDVGNPVREVDPRQNVTVMAYDGLNRLRQTVLAFGTPQQASQSIQYSSTGLKSATIDENTNETDYGYDGAGRLVTITGPAVDDGTGTNHATRPTTTHGYDSNGNLTSVQDPRLKTTTYAFDERNRKITETHPAVFNPATGNQDTPIIQTSYDPTGNVASVTDARLNTTTTSHDRANRPTTVTFPAAPLFDGTSPQTTHVTTYDLNGNVYTVTDQNNHTTTNGYDSLNRLTSTQDAQGITVHYGYDSANNRTSVQDGNQQTTTFTYDGLNRNTSITDPVGKSTVLVYDGLVETTRTDAMSQVTHYDYDSRNRLFTVKYDDGDANHANDRTYSYDPVGNLLSVNLAGHNAIANVTYTYDALNRAITETSNGFQHAYAYDPNGNRTRILYGGSNRLLVSAYDDDNRLQTLTDGAAVTTYVDDLNGNNVSLTLPNGDVTTTIFDTLNRRQSIDTESAGNALLEHFDYGYDGVGNVRTINESYGTANVALNRTVTNTYDNIDRLQTEAVTGNGAASTTYVYDNANNRTSKTVTTGGNVATTNYVFENALNQLKSYTDPQGTTVTFGYNDDGNRTSSTAGNAVYGYDFENRLVSLTQNGNTYNYTYDYRSRRVERVENASATEVVFSGGTSVQEYVNNALNVEYLRGSDWGGGVGGLLYSLRGGLPSFSHYDGRGDVTEKTNSTGTVTYQATYEAYGTRPNETGSTQDRQKANTKEEDPSGLLNEGMRYRDLVAGVFITRDPAGFVDGPNLYTYVRQNPWTAFDPEGLSEKRFVNGELMHNNMQHRIPVSSMQELDFDPAVAKEIDKRRVATAYPHGAAGHSDYTSLVTSEIRDSLPELKKRGLSPTFSGKRMSEQQAKQVADELERIIDHSRSEYVRWFDKNVRVLEQGVLKEQAAVKLIEIAGKEGRAIKPSWIKRAGSLAKDIPGLHYVIGVGFAVLDFREAKAAGMDTTQATGYAAAGYISPVGAVVPASKFTGVEKMYNVYKGKNNIVTITVHPDGTVGSREGKTENAPWLSDSQLRQMTK